MHVPVSYRSHVIQYAFSRIEVIFFALLFLYQLSFHFIKIQRGKQNRKHNSETYTLKCQNQRASLQIIITCSKISYYKLCFKHLTVVTKLLVRRFHYKRLLFSPQNIMFAKSLLEFTKKKQTIFNFSKLSVKILVVYSCAVCQFFRRNFRVCQLPVLNIKHTLV